MTANKDNTKYLKSWAEELMARANRVRDLIGDRHWLTDGHHKEVIVREFLRRYLPNCLEIGSGFIKPLDGSLCSTEVDILISNPTLHPAYFNEGGIQILPPSSVAAYIEMKSSFSASSFEKALNAMSSTQESLGENAKEVWRCICFCHVNVSLSSFVNSIEKKLSAHIFDKSDIANRLPTCIASFENYVVFVRFDTEKGNIILNSFDLGKLSIAAAFCDLFEHARYLLGGNNSGELSKYLDNLNNTGYQKKVIELNEQQNHNVR